MGDEPGDDADDRRRADVYSSARIGAAAALTIVLVVLLVLDVAVPDYDISPGILLPLLGAIFALLGLEASAVWRGREVTSIYWVGSPKYTAGHPTPLIALVHHRMVGTLRSTDAAFTSTDGREASTSFGVGYGCGLAGHPTTAHVHQYVRLGDQAWGNGNWDPSGAWDDRYATRLLNGRTVSIEHHDNGGRTAGSGKGVVPEAVIVASVALDALLLRGDLAELKGAGIRFRSGTETAITRELRAMPIDRHHLIDHHYIAGRLKPSCWRPWADDPVGFPQARYLAALAPAPATEETVNSYPVPKVPSIATVPAGTGCMRRLRSSPRPTTSVWTRGAKCPISASRRARFVSSSTSTRRASIRVARCSRRRPEVTTIRPAPDPTPFSQAQVDAAEKTRGRGGQCGRRPRSRRVRSVTVMDSQPGTIWGREPAMVLALVQALIALVVAFGDNFAPDQIGAILAVTAVILGLITRSRVSPAS